MNRHKILPLIASALALIVIGVMESCSGHSSPMNSNGYGGNNNNNNPPPTNSVNIAGMAYSPSALTVKVGTKVTWTNNDTYTHTVTSDNGAFTSSGNLAPDNTYQVTFMTAGSFPYHCSIHTYMTGSITVTP